MAVVQAILQPVIPGDIHAQALKELLRCDWATNFVLSSAFVNAAGISAIADDLSNVSSKCRAFIGVRNGSTTAQGIMGLLKAGVSVYAVDTATRFRIFHPKVYIARNEERATVLLSSSNLTHAGLFNNIEAGARIELDLANESDRAFLQKFEHNLNDLPVRFQENCYPLTSARTVVTMIRDGRLENERDQKVISAFGVARSGGSDVIKPKIDLPYTPPPRIRRRRRPAARPAPAGAPHAPATVPHFGNLVWEKPTLPRRDLQLLLVGHNPGVLALTQAKFEVGISRIDQTTYFRNEVFESLNWTPDPNDPGKEKASAKFSLVIGGVYAGDFVLKLSHKPAWEAGSGSYTTAFHWGDATEYIQREELIGRSLRLYQPALPDNPYIIEID